MAACCTANAAAVCRRPAFPPTGVSDASSVAEIGRLLAAQVGDAVLRRLPARRRLAVAGVADAQRLGEAIGHAEDVGHRRHLAAGRALATDVADLLGDVDVEDGPPHEASRMSIRRGTIGAWPTQAMRTLKVGGADI